MIEKRACPRCGAERTDYLRYFGLDLCESCQMDFEEFMMGAPVIKWNPIKTKEMTPEDLAAIGFPNEEGSATLIDGLEPEDGQTVLISGHFSDGDAVVSTVAYRDNPVGWVTSLGLGWEDITAWAAIPEPYKPEEDGGGTNGD